jgi:hypothetical protein
MVPTPNDLRDLIASSDESDEEEVLIDTSVASTGSSRMYIRGPAGNLEWMMVRHDLIDVSEDEDDTLEVDFSDCSIPGVVGRREWNSTIWLGGDKEEDELEGLDEDYQPSPSPSRSGSDEGDEGDCDYEYESDYRNSPD